MTQAPSPFDEETYAHWASLFNTGQAHNPRAFLGRHSAGKGQDVVRFYLPDAARVEVSVGAKAAKAKVRQENRAADYAKDGIYAILIPAADPTPQVHVAWGAGVHETLSDPYSQPLVVGDLDMHLLGEGTHMRLFEFMGCTWQKGLARFVVWAPNARAVSLIGDLNGWDARRHPLENRGNSGLWELTVPEAKPGQVYKFRIRTADSTTHDKADPYATHAEMRPKTGSVIPERDFLEHKATDNRRRMDHDAPMSIYEVHLGSWRKHDGWRFYSYTDLARELVDYAVWMGFTHIELLPIHEHPLDASWGYQPTGMYAATSRFGPPKGLKALVEAAHTKGLGVILDWVPAHFPKDAHGLACFDGTALYEHSDPKRGEHRDWGTLIYNFGRPEVRAFLLSNAAYWIEVFGIDGLRVDAVASMLYLDYSREADDWEPNEFGGRENLEAIAFVRALNQMIYRAYPHCAMIAEESTAWPGVSRPLADGDVASQPAVGPLGFGYKWNMGWMNDSLRYLKTQCVHRAYDHRLATFSLDYVYDENFVLPLSHDEVVHGKGSLLSRAAAASPGDQWQTFANLRAYMGYMFAHPGKKLLFMGQELAAPFEWSEADPLDWSLEEVALHAQFRAYVRHLNQVYVSTPALHAGDCQNGGFSWLDGGDAARSILATIRWDSTRKDPVIAISNFTPVPRIYEAGAPVAGPWIQLSNSDLNAWGGSNAAEIQPILAENRSYQGQPFRVSISLPPLATVLLGLA